MGYFKFHKRGHTRPRNVLMAYSGRTGVDAGYRGTTMEKTVVVPLTPMDTLLVSLWQKYHRFVPLFTIGVPWSYFVNNITMVNKS